MITEKDIQDGKKISEIFAVLSEENKNMAIVYLSALRDKELADSSKDNNQEKRFKYKDFGISDYLFDYVNDWIEYKKENHFTYKETGLKNLLRQISESADKYGDEAVAAVIKESIASGYKGIVFDKLAKNKKEEREKNNSFNNFFQREYDYNELEQKLLSNI